MPSRTANRNVHQADVFESPPPAPLPEVGQVDDLGSRTLRRGLKLLEAVMGGGPGGLRVIDLCRATGLGRAPVYRLLATLVDSGYVAQCGRFRYVAGACLAALAQPSGTPNMAVWLQPLLAHVSAICGDAAFAVMREGSLSHCIGRHVGTHPVQVLVIQVGTRQPLGVGAAGLALLAALPDEEVSAIIDANALTLGQYGGMTPERMRILVRTTRERGWSVVGNHATQGVLAAGMAVRNAKGAPVAAISVASTIDRMPRERQQMIARAMREALDALRMERL